VPQEVQIVAIDEHQEKIACASTDTPQYSAGPNNAAYVIYTSGSTGRPKGVVIEHRNMLHMVQAQREAFGVRETDTVLQFFSFSFDVSVFATLMALCAGARLVLGSREELLPGPGLLRLLESEEVTVGVLPPVVLDHLPEARLPKRPFRRLWGNAAQVKASHLSGAPFSMRESICWMTKESLSPQAWLENCTLAAMVWAGGTWTMR
jgi:non-ribosomal peptide synthetase component F